MNKKPIGVLIDGENICLTLITRMRGTRFHWNKFKECLTARKKPLLLNYYGSSENQYLLEKLKRFGYSLRLKNPRSYPGKSGETRRKCNCDIEIAVDAMLLAATRTVSEIYLVSGDGDFTYLVTTLAQQYAIPTTVMCFKNSSATNLIMASARVEFLEDL